MQDFQLIYNNKCINLSKEEVNQANISTLSEHKYHILFNNKSIVAELTKINLQESIVEFQINEAKYLFQIKNQLAQTIAKLGFTDKDAKVEKSIKAPMPGIVNKIHVSEGDSVSKGQNLLTLEAMKMENIIKSASSGIIQKILIRASDKVEKNQDLIILE